MSNSISNLLIRNLRDVFGENDARRRRAAIDEIYTEDGVFYDPTSGVYRGRDEIDRIAGAIKATYPDFRYQPIAGPEELGDGGRVRWVSGRPVRRQLMLVLISSLPGTAGLPPFISFLTSYPDATVGRIDRLNPKFNQARKGECNEQSNPHLRASHFRKCSARPRRSSGRSHDRRP